MSRNSRSREQWERIINLYAQSGQTKADFCRQQKISVLRFYYWCNLLRPDFKSFSQKSNTGKKKQDEDFFIPIKTPPKTSNVRIKLQNGLELEFLSMPDSAWMATLICNLGRQNVITQ
ncbi:MAG TPA: hypothetical protein DCW58_01845 [Candidatus Pacebacteria bacterium]|nr:hypothetical protein [Candidatus Paceibacterota bacterium]